MINKRWLLLFLVFMAPLLRSSELYDEAQHSFQMHGITAQGVKIDVGTMVQRKDNIVTQLTSGIKGLFKKNKVTLLPGHGKFVGREGDRWLVDVNGEKVEATHVIVATGSLKCCPDYFLGQYWPYHLY